ncbi:MAG: hypothetical protein J2P45_08940 [Candidatus Dormibacteraeota bacterium]|nr:hypothetical protein [Candidatus Dormibacteraeota bacterium]
MSRGDSASPLGALNAVPSTKLRPVIVERGEVPADLARLLRGRAGSLTLVHAPAGYGKTTALALTQRPGWHWYSLDSSDQAPRILASRLCGALGVEPLTAQGPADGEAVALELAARLDGQALTVTFDRYEQLGHAPEVGRMLDRLLALLPGLALRVATRTRPELPLERLRLEGRLVEVDAAHLRLPKDHLRRLLRAALGRAPSSQELLFADVMLGGWPGAVHLWLAGLDGGDDLMAPLRPDKPLYGYLHEELLLGTLDPRVVDGLWEALPWLVGEGPLLERLAAPEHRRVAEALIRDRAGVVSGPGGWQLHPLVDAFLGMHVGAPDHGAGPGAGGPAVRRPAADSRVVVRALGELVVEVEGQMFPKAAWPSASRRLLELLLSVPMGQVTADQAAQLLWPGYLSRSAQNSFNVALHRLRRILEPELRSGPDSRYVVRDGRWYRLRLDRLTCDATDFEVLARYSPDANGGGRSLEMALELYRGDFLSSSAERFVHERRERLRQLRMEVLERLGRWYRGSGRAEQALSAFEGLLELAPWREDVWALVLELHVECGDEYRALAALHRCEQSLRSAGIEPSGLLRELRSRIRGEAWPTSEEHSGNPLRPRQRLGPIAQARRPA